MRLYSKLTFKHDCHPTKVDPENRTKIMRVLADEKGNLIPFPTERDMITPKSFWSFVTHLTGLVSDWIYYITVPQVNDQLGDALLLMLVITPFVTFVRNMHLWLKKFRPLTRT